MSILVMANVFAANLKTPTRKAVLLAIADHADDTGQNSYQSYETLAAKANVHKRTVIRCCKDFVDEGLLIKAGEVRCRGGFTINYTVKLDALTQLQSGDTESPVNSEVVTDDPESGDTAPPNPSITHKKDNNKRGSRLSPDWRPPEGLTAFYTEHGFDRQGVQAEFAKFQDYWIAVPGTKGRKLDWLATWRNWIRNSQSSHQGGRNGKRPSFNRGGNKSGANYTRASDASQRRYDDQQRRSEAARELDAELGYD